MQHQHAKLRNQMCTFGQFFGNFVRKKHFIVWVYVEIEVHNHYDGVVCMHITL